MYHVATNMLDQLSKEEVEGPEGLPIGKELRTMKRRIETTYEDHTVSCGLSTKFKHYRVMVDGEAAGWVILESLRAYNAKGDNIGTFRTLEQAARAVAEWHIYFC